MSALRVGTWVAGLALGLLAMSDPVSARGGAIRPVRLRCEYLANPLGVDVARPRLSWALAARGKARGEVQSAYQVLAATSRERLREGRADLWDTGRVASAETLHREYAGAPLRSGQRVWWKVRAWDRAGRPSAWSEPAWWEMALLSADEWRAKWINGGEPYPVPEERLYEEHPAPLLRKEFTLSGQVRRARAYVSGLGYYELRLNGAKVGEQVLDPGWTTYSKRVLYATHDVTALLRRGRNALGLILGRWNLRETLTTGRPRGILHLEIEYADGSRETVVTDETWRTALGPIVRNDLYLGEVYDARRERPGWDAPGFDDSGWSRATVAREPIGPLQAQFLPPVRVTRTLKALRVTAPQPGVHIVDFGQNFAGWVTLKARGPAGTRVRLRYGELLHADGTLNVMTSVAGQIKAPGVGGPSAPPVAWQEDTYILKGAGEETWTPRFTWHGFRYVEVTGFPGAPTRETLTGHRLNSDVEPAGAFSCSSALFNKIQDVTLWTQLSNMMSVQSDCPHRERFGYGGDIVAASEMALLNFDVGAFYTKAVRDLEDAARPNGGFTETAPFVGIADEGLGGDAGPVGWGTAHPLLLAQLHQYYGDRRLMREQYAAAKRWVALLEARAENGILDNGISDHESLVPKSRALTGTAFYFLNVRLLARFARRLGHTEDAERYEALAASIREAFNRRFLQPEAGRYDTGTQASQSFALYFGLVPEAERARAVEALVHDVLVTHKGHLSTGIFGTKYLLDVLSTHGRADVAATVVGQKEFPGWGYMLANGATTLWEHWAWDDRVFSHNHPMFGSVSEWFIKHVAGIRPAEDAEGFDRVVIQPRVVGGLTWAKGRYESIRGRIESVWKVRDGVLTLDVTLPPNVTAKIHVPTSDTGAVTESGVRLERVPGLSDVRVESSGVILQAGSGRYRFVAPWRPRE
jgi:alpha-L-rhamnosidase